MGKNIEFNKFQYLLGSITAIMCVLAVSAPTFAASSKWFETDGAKIRLISLPSPDGKRIQAGLQIDLEKGWKTYWRSPGASGLPPQISFSGSKNIASTNLRFPIPSTFGEKDNLTAGYLKPVTILIDIEPLYTGRPVTFNVSGVLGICEKICVPVQFQFTLEEDGTGVSTPDITSAILAAQGHLSTAPHKNLKILKVEVVGNPKTELYIEANVPKNTKSGTLFVEGPDNWYLTPVKANSIDGDLAKFTVVLDNLPKNSDPNATSLKFTLVADGKGINQEMVPTAGN